MKGKKLAAILLTLGVAASFVGATALTSCKKKSSGPYTGPKQTEFANKTPESQAKTIYVGTAKGKADGSSIDDPYDFYDFFMRQVARDDDNTILTPGTRIKVTPGTHKVNNNVKITKEGAYNDYIFIEAADPDNEKGCTLDFSAMEFGDKNRGVEIYGNYFYFRNIDICGAGDNGLYIGGSYNIVENCEFYNNRDTGLQLGRSYGSYTNIKEWPSYNLIKNCTSHNNYDNETYGENADGFAAKLTVGYGNIFDGCIAYRNSDDGWDLFGKADTGTIGRVIIYNSVAFENGFLQETQQEYNARFPEFRTALAESNTLSYLTRDGDGNGFKLGGSTLAGDVYVYNCLSFNNRMHGVTDNSNPGNLSINGVTAYNNGAVIDNVSYLDIHDEANATTYIYTDKASTTTADVLEEKAYYNVDQDGYIVDANNNKIVVRDELVTYRPLGKTSAADNKTETAKVWRKNTYVALDKDGYIMSNVTKNEYYLLDSGEEADRVTGTDKFKVKGSYVKIDYEKSIKNENFGKINTGARVDGEDEQCNNIDIERWADESYNSFSNVLSVADADNKYTGKDRYRGSGNNSLLNATGGKWSEITTAIDADQKAGKAGTSKTQVAASDIFEKLPAADFGFNAESWKFHDTLRNEDGSINMGDLFKIKDYSKLLSNGSTDIGCDLTKTTWADYTHWDYTFMTDSNYVRNQQEAFLRAAESLLYVQTDIDNCYQNFYIINQMLDCNVTWTSSNTSILNILDNEIDPGVSRHLVNLVDVTRAAEDTVVTLTATITSPDNSITVQKVFEINVMHIIYEIGEIEVEGEKEGNVVMDRTFDGAAEPQITVRNAADYSGKIVPEGSYEVETVYWFQGSQDAALIGVDAFDPSEPGIYKIDKTIKIGNQTKEKSFRVFVVAGNLKLVFSGETDTEDGDTSLAIKHDGFNISGNLSNVKGSMHVLTTAAGAAAPTKDQVKADGEKVNIDWNKITFDFKHSNEAAYDVYYVLCNPDGDITSKLYKKSVEIVEISTKEAFNELATTGGDASKIYQLTTDLDYTGTTWKAVKASTDVGFKGLFDGKGHTIKGIKAVPGSSADKGLASVFPLLYGGSIMNVNFEEIVLDGKEDVGIIAQTQGGYIYNVHMKNITATGVQRISALVGHVYEQSSAAMPKDNGPLIIDRVSLINTDPNCVIEGKTSRAGGIVGFMQIGGGTLEAIVTIEISNCYVNASIGSETSQQNGGIFAVYDTSNNAANITCSLTITNCYFAGTVKSSSRCGGILGYHNGLQKLVIYGCINTGAIYHAGETEPLAAPHKNASGIMGGYSAAGDVRISWCYSNIAEHNSNYGVEPIEGTTLFYKDVWEESMGFDMKEAWEFVQNPTNESMLVSPFIKLRGALYE